MIRPSRLCKGSDWWLANLGVSWQQGGSSSFHHGETQETIIFEEFDDLLYGFRHNKEYLNSIRNNQQYKSMEDTKESPSSMGGEVEKVLHQED